MHRRTRLAAWNVYVLVPFGLAAWVGSLALRQAAPLVAAAFVLASAVAGASLARRYRLAALGAGGELREFERSRLMVWSMLGARERQRRRVRRTRGEHTRIVGQ